MASCGHRLKTIFVVQAAEHRSGDDTVSVADPMAAGRWREPIVGRIGDAGPETGVRPSPIVVSHPFCKHAPHVALVPRNHEIETLTSNGANQPLAEGVGLWRPHRRLDDRESIAAIARSTPSE